MVSKLLYRKPLVRDYASSHILSHNVAKYAVATCHHGNSYYSERIIEGFLSLNFIISFQLDDELYFLFLQCKAGSLRFNINISDYRVPNCGIFRNTAVSAFLRRVRQIRHGQSQSTLV